MALALLLASEAPAITEEGKRRYREGVRALEAGRLEPAVAALSAAIDDDPREGVQKFRGTGVSFEDYFPHLYLGLALERLGRAADATRELGESLAQGAVLARPEQARRLSAALERARAAARERPTEPPAQGTAPPPPGPPAALVVPPQQQPTTVAPPAAAASATPVPDPSTRPPLHPRLPPTPSLPRFVAVPAPVSGPQPAAAPSGAAFKTRVAGDLAEAISAAPSGAAFKTRVAGDLAEAISAAPSGAAFKTRVSEGIRLYFAGDYRAARLVLEPLAESAPGARLVLAYALAAQFLIGRPRDPALLEQARRERARALAEGAREDGRFVSPSVRRLLEGGR